MGEENRGTDRNLDSEIVEYIKNKLEVKESFIFKSKDLVIAMERKFESDIPTKKVAFIIRKLRRGDRNDIVVELWDGSRELKKGLAKVWVARKKR